MGLVYFLAVIGVGVAILGIYQVMKYPEVFFKKKSKA